MNILSLEAICLLKDYNEFSDIDIIIFSHSHINAQNHTIIIGTKKVQIIVVPMINLSEAFFNDYYSLKGSFTHMIANSSIEIINNKGNYKIRKNAILTPKINPQYCGSNFSIFRESY